MQHMCINIDPKRARALHTYSAIPASSTLPHHPATTVGQLAHAARQQVAGTCNPSSTLPPSPICLKCTAQALRPVYIPCTYRAEALHLHSTDVK